MTRQTSVFHPGSKNKDSRSRRSGRLLKDYAEREGIHVVQEFEDVETAKRAGRTSFSEMVAFLRKKSSGCRTLLVEKTDHVRSRKSFTQLH